MKPKTYVYCRVSSARGKQSTESQEHSIRAYLKAHGIRNVHWVREHKSGRKRRETFEQVLQDIQSGKCNRLLVYKVDRLSRASLREALDNIQTIVEAGCTLIVTSQGIVLEGSGSPMSHFLLSLFSILARWESDLISERVLAGQAVAKANGKRWGGSQPHKMQRYKVKRKIEAGHSITSIAKSLKISRQSVYGMLDRMAS